MVKQFPVFPLITADTKSEGTMEMFVFICRRETWHTHPPPPWPPPGSPRPLLPLPPPLPPPLLPPPRQQSANHQILFRPNRNKLQQLGKGLRDSQVVRNEKN